MVDVDFKCGLVSLCRTADTVSLSPERLSMNDCSDVELRAAKRAHSYLYLHLSSLSLSMKLGFFSLGKRSTFPPRGFKKPIRNFLMKVSLKTQIKRQMCLLMTSLEMLAEISWHDTTCISCIFGYLLAPTWNATGYLQGSISTTLSPEHTHWPGCFGQPVEIDIPNRDFCQGLLCT